MLISSITSLLFDLNGNKASKTNYSIDVLEELSTLTAEISAGTGDADLYVSFGSPPTKSNYDCRPYEYGNNETCELPRNGGKAYIMTHAYSSYSGVSLEASSQ